MDFVLGMIFGLFITSLFAFMFGSLNTSSKLSEMRTKLVYTEALAEEYKRLAKQYYNLYYETHAKLIAKPSAQPASNSSVSWRTVLGFSKGEKLSKLIITTRYKKLAMIYHPDSVGGSDYAMKLLNLAKEKADTEFK